MPHMICSSGLDYNSKHGATYSTLWSLINCQERIVEGMMDYTTENINEAHSRQHMKTRADVTGCMGSPFLLVSKAWSRV